MDKSEAAKHEVFLKIGMINSFKNTQNHTFVKFRIEVNYANIFSLAVDSYNP